MRFLSDPEERRSFEVPLGEVSRAVQQKDDVALEVHYDDTAGEQTALVELRLHLPGDATSVLQAVRSRADLGATSGTGLVALDQLPVLTPRGRYNIEMFSSFMKLYGKTYDYKILYSNISRLFQLPKPDHRHVFFVVSLDPPIRQGQTRYPHLVLQFPEEETLEVSINFPKENTDKFKEKFPELKETMKGKAFEVVSRIFTALTKRKITFPNTFQSHGGASAVKCSLKANEGFMYPLERSFFFVHKPPTHIRFDEVAHVEFARVSSSATGTTNRTFDLSVTLKNSTVYQFTSILRFVSNVSS